MSLSSSGISSAGSVYPDQLCQITGLNSTVGIIENSTRN